MPEGYIKYILVPGYTGTASNSSKHPARHILSPSAPEKGRRQGTLRQVSHARQREADVEQYDVCHWSLPEAQLICPHFLYQLE
jgi:hypothetical protein